MNLIFFVTLKLLPLRMSRIEQLEQLGTSAVRQLRISRLKRGFPFMISSRSLPADQSYLEYPEGKITIVTYTRNAKEFTELRELSREETSKVRDQFELDLIS
jgi:hypothetical protein